MGSNTARDRARRLAGRQYGVIARSQALEAGLSASALKRLIVAGHLERWHPGVYRVAGAPASIEQRILAATFAAGLSAASHTTAAWLWGLLEDPPVEPEITVPATHLPRLAGVTVHRSKAFRRAVVRRRRGIPLTDPLWTLVHLGAVLPSAEVEDALDRGLVSRLVTVEAVKATLDRLGRPGRNGSGVLRTVLARRALGDDRPDSMLEPRLARLLRRHRVPTPVFQHPVMEDGRQVARIDFAYPELGIAIEADGYEKRSSPAALQHDDRRHNKVVLRGWKVLRFTRDDIDNRPLEVVAEVRQALRAARS